MLQRLWEAVGEGEWAVIPGKAGVYTHVGDEACDILAKAGWPASMPSATIQVDAFSSCSPISSKTAGFS